MREILRIIQVIQTTVTGDDIESYNRTERQAKAWFFARYDCGAKTLLDNGMDPMSIVHCAIEIGHLSPTWIECPHPQIVLGKQTLMFGHHTGFNPTSPGDTWGFKFEILPFGEG